MAIPSLTRKSAVILLGTLPLFAIAQPGSGIRVGEQTVLSPSVSGNISYNDNLNLQRRALSRPEQEFEKSNSDFYLESVLALRLSHRSEQTTYLVRTWYSERRYQDFSELDRENYGITASWQWLAPHGRTGIDGSFSAQQAADRLESIQEVNPESSTLEFETATERVKRDQYSARLNVDQQLLQAVRGSLSYSLKDTQYVDDRFNDSTEHLVASRVGFEISQKATPFITAGIRYEDNEGLDGTGENPFVQAGLRYIATDKINFNGSIGYERFIRTPMIRERDPLTGQANRVPGEELTDSGLKFGLTLNYAATDKSFLQFSARRGFGSLSNTSTNAREETIVSTRFTHRTTERIQQSFVVTWQDNDFEEPFLVNGEEIDENSDTRTFQYSLNYQTVRTWMAFFALVSYEDNNRDAATLAHHTEPCSHNAHCASAPEPDAGRTGGTSRTGTDWPNH